MIRFFSFCCLLFLCTNTSAQTCTCCKKRDSGQAAFDRKDYQTALNRWQEGTGGRGLHPVINVDWYDAVEYCNWLSVQQKRTPAYTIDKNRQDPNNSAPSDAKKWIVSCNFKANGYRLPTEAEWEYAAREGGKKVRFGSGKDLANPTQINFCASTKYKLIYSVVGENRQQTVEVGSLRSPNALDLHDMSGNVWEWCEDWYDNYPLGAQTNPTGPAQGLFRVLRGGDWFYDASLCRATYRAYNEPSTCGAELGFRLVFVSLQLTGGPDGLH